jgi:hypothetical protein
VIANGDPVGISAQVLKDTFGAIEGGFTIDDPLLMIELVPEYLKVLGLLEMADTIGKDQLLFFEGIFEKIEELASKQSRHHPDGKKKSFPAGSPGAIGREASPRDNTVEVGMVHEVLTPRMENTDHAYGCPEMFWVVCKFCECLGDRTEKKVIHDLAVRGDQEIEFRRKGEDDMEVFNGQKILTASLDPFLFA